MTPQRLPPLRAKTPILSTIFAVILLAAPVPAHADAVGKKPVRRSQPAHTLQSAKDTTGSINKAKPVPQQVPMTTASAPDEEKPLSPYYLPDVPRARMRACGETWRSKKMAGAVGDDAWRDFASKCLAAKDPSPVQ